MNEIYIEVDQSDLASIINRHNRAIGQINGMLCDFSQLDPPAKTGLMMCCVISVN